LTASIVTMPSYCDCHREQNDWEGDCLSFMSQRLPVQNIAALLWGVISTVLCRVEYTISPPQIIPLSFAGLPL
jgi:hypothetical protein